MVITSVDLWGRLNSSITNSDWWQWWCWLTMFIDGISLLCQLIMVNENDNWHCPLTPCSQDWLCVTMIDDWWNVTVICEQDWWLIAHDHDCLHVAIIDMPTYNFMYHIGSSFQKGAIFDIGLISPYFLNQLLSQVVSCVIHKQLLY